MSEQYYDALLEISKAYLSDFIDTPYKHNFASSSEEWLRQRGFYDTYCIIPYPPHERWRSMMGMPPCKKVTRYFDENGNLINEVLA